MKRYRVFAIFFKFEVLVPIAGATKYICCFTDLTMLFFARHLAAVFALGPIL